MIKVTDALRTRLAELCDLKKDAGEDEVRKAAAGALIAGRLTAEQMEKLVKDPDEDEVDEFSLKMNQMADSLARLAKALEPKANEKKADEKKEDEKKADEKKEDEKKADEKKEDETKAEPSRMAKMIAAMGGISDGDSIDARVKSAVEQYSSTKSVLTYPSETKAGRPHQLAGQRVTEFGRGLDSPSDRDKALAGVWAKWQILCATPRFAGNAKFAWERLTEHEKSLLAHLCEEGEWDDSTDGRPRTRKGYAGGVKALIDESGTSRGQEAAPIVFDDMVIQAPLLYGELYPLVNTVPLDRGRRVEGVQTGTVTGSWGGVDASAISLFNFASYVTAFDTTIYRWQGACQVGLDFMEDTPIDFGAHITAQYGERLLEDLDDVIAVGNGSTQPEGVITNGGTSVAFGGSNSIGNMESLRFAVGKAEHKGSVAGTAVFCGTETSYQRIKALSVGSSDARRLFAGASTNTGTYDDYSLMNRPFKINESLTNAQMFYAILARYRMYRRKGFQVRTSTEGDTLIRANEMLIVVMARYGGQLERAAAAGVTTTAPA